VENGLVGLYVPTRGTWSNSLRGERHYRALLAGKSSYPINAFNPPGLVHAAADCFGVERWH
jgi:hypothetical protein